MFHPVYIYIYIYIDISSSFHLQNRDITSPVVECCVCPCVYLLTVCYIH